MTAKYKKVDVFHSIIGKTSTFLKIMLYFFFFSYDHVNYEAAGRFDKVWCPVEEKRTSLHQEDLCQILNLYPSEKYRLSLTDAFKAIETWCTAPLIEKINLLRLYFFSYLVGNGDLHGKNISFYVDPVDGRVALTPAYDVLCTLVYGDQTMALKMDGKDKNFSRKDFIEFGTRSGLPPKSVISMMDSVLQKFNLHHHILFSIDLPDKNLNFLARTIEVKLKKLSA